LEQEKQKQVNESIVIEDIEGDEDNDEDKDNDDDNDEDEDEDDVEIVVATGSESVVGGHQCVAQQVSTFGET